ncbi:hypothetical protein E1267_01530 [Nonomuraea longispora]|uniref:Uncharacterized protein n=1 Tax=Nonomuraea longispora TaxID=1848320 RepID=A0A4R4NNQ7_9ACTN|nr:hypothetical protein [Nonomuraea longispora]TDC11138.1 hypothetical protein E1267_01530 [Nonomuraea longispora]
MRPLACATTAAALALCGIAAPAEATTGVGAVYGYAWSDGQGRLRIAPKSASFVKRKGFLGYRLKAAAGAKELRLDYSRAAYGRITVACDLKETEGRVALDRKGLGRTRCSPRDLATELGRGPVPVRVEHHGGRAVRVNEFVVADRPGQRSARGTIRRIDDTTVEFASGDKKIKLRPTYATGFYRTTARCTSGWLAGRPVNADKDGLGTKPCTPSHLTKALKTVRHPVLGEIEYTPGAGSLDQVWEVFGDA